MYSTWKDYTPHQSIFSFEKPMVTSSKPIKRPEHFRFSVLSTLAEDVSKTSSDIKINPEIKLPVEVKLPSDFKIKTEVKLPSDLNIKELEVKELEVKAPEAKAPEAKAPEAKAPEAKAPEAKAPEAKAPEAKAPEAKAPEEKVKEKETKDNQAKNEKDSFLKDNAGKIIGVIGAGVLAGLAYNNFKNRDGAQSNISSLTTDNNGNLIVGFCSFVPICLSDSIELSGTPSPSVDGTYSIISSNSTSVTLQTKPPDSFTNLYSPTGFCNPSTDPILSYMPTSLSCAVATTGPQGITLCASTISPASSTPGMISWASASDPNVIRIVQDYASYVSNPSTPNMSQCQVTVSGYPSVCAGFTGPSQVLNPTDVQADFALTEYLNQKYADSIANPPTSIVGSMGSLGTITIHTSFNSQVGCEVGKDVGVVVKSAAGVTKDVIGTALPALKDMVGSLAGSLGLTDLFNKFSTYFYIGIGLILLFFIYKIYTMFKSDTPTIIQVPTTVANRLFKSLRRAKSRF
jgi:hypothetical protein